jgi:transcriptional regulator with XRE-family HTH domain
MEDFYEAFGPRLARVRRKCKVSQELLGSRVGLSRTSIVNVEKGRQRVPLHMLVSFADALGVAPSELLPPRATTVVEGSVPKSIEGMDQGVQAFVMRLIGPDGLDEPATEGG